MFKKEYIIQDNQKGFIYEDTMASFNLSVFDHPDIYLVINEEVAIFCRFAQIKLSTVVQLKMF